MTEVELQAIEDDATRLMSLSPAEDRILRLAGEVRKAWIEIKTLTYQLDMGKRDR